MGEWDKAARKHVESATRTEAGVDELKTVEVATLTAR